MTFLGVDGQRVARVDLEALRSSIAPKDIEITRDDLSNILHEACRRRRVHLTQDRIGVDLTFVRSRLRRFDLVIGVGGLHSVVRSLAFGADS
jgi:2-polyprenyl-6-methoxyphenol hydroxylase-like FAD-dependent oxidoreductase